MAVDLCRDNSNRGFGMNIMNYSPRYSFSHDLNQSDLIPIESLQSSLLDYDFDFDFCVSRRSCDGESSLADELFSDGVILPVEIKTKKKVPKTSISTPSSPLLSPLPKSSVQNRGETEEEETEEKQGNSKSFWKFKRSKSFNCGSLYKKGLLWHLPLLPRSKSTGSNPCDDKRSLNSNPKDEAHHHHHRNQHRNHENSNGGMKNYYQKNNSSSPQNHQKPPLKKNYGSSSSSSSYNYGNLRVSPVLNVPTEKLLGFASIFSHKSKKK